MHVLVIFAPQNPEPAVAVEGVAAQEVDAAYDYYGGGVDEPEPEAAAAQPAIDPMLHLDQAEEEVSFKYLVPSYT